MSKWVSDKNPLSAIENPGGGRNWEGAPHAGGSVPPGSSTSEEEYSLSPPSIRGGSLSEECGSEEWESWSSDGEIDAFPRDPGKSGPLYVLLAGSSGRTEAGGRPRVFTRRQAELRVGAVYYSKGRRPREDEEGEGYLGTDALLPPIFSERNVHPNSKREKRDR